MEPTPSKVNPVSKDTHILARGDEPAIETTKKGADLASMGDPHRTVVTSPAGGPTAILPGLRGYDITGELARGGMGIVYHAMDHSFHRSVAIKIVQERYASNASTCRRFFEEAQITGQLQHPAIPPVHELGTLPDGRPYLVMKLINGQTLDVLLANRERCSSLLDGEELGKQTSPAELARFMAIFGQICQAIGYAHNQGVIHRDLKPQNIMVGAFGEVQVMDWGLAKLLKRNAQPNTDSETSANDTNTSFKNPRDDSDGSETQPGSVLGTPSYMPPEQAEGKIDAIDQQSDVFGLGAILCQILTGQPPFTGDSVEAIRKQVVQGDLRQAFARLERCGAESELIALCKRCLSPTKADRPPDGGAVALAVDTLRLQAEARAVQVEKEHLKSLVRETEQRKRRRVVQVATALVTTLLLLGIAVLSIGLVKVSQLNADLLETNHQLSVAQADALASAKAAKEHAAEANAVLNFVEDQIFAAARPKDQAGGLGFDVKLKDALVAALPHVEPSFKDKPLIEARLRLVLGVSFAYLRNDQQAVDQFLQARKIFTEQLGPKSPQTLRASNNLATALDHLSQHLDALRLREETLQAQLETLGPEHPDTLASLNNLAVSYYTTGRVADSLRMSEQLLATYSRLNGPDDSDTLLAMHNVARCHTALGRNDKALPLYQEMFSKQQAKLGVENPDTLRTMQALGITYAAVGRQEDALKLREQVLTLRKKVLGSDHPDTLSAMVMLAGSYANLNRNDDAIKLLEQTLDLQRSQLGPNHTSMLLTMLGLAEQYVAVGRHEAALKLREETLAMQKERFGPDHPQTLLGMLGLSRSLMDAKRWSEAGTLLDDCIQRALRAAIPIELLAEMLSDRLKVCVQLHDATGCRTAAEIWEKLGRTDARSLYHAACIRAIVAAVHMQASGAEAVRLANENADLAMAWLTKAVAAGWKNRTHMEKDSDLDFLRNRSDFKKLLESLPRE